jgi:alpha-ribazole phosphatase
MTLAASQQQRHVFAIRHGVPDVAAGLCYGNTDLALVPGANDAVLTQHAALLARARAENWPVFSSPLRRCASLAAQIRPDFQTDPRLREWDFGDWEMCAWDTVPRAELDEWAADPVHYRPGGRESLMMIVQRLKTFLTELPPSGEPVLLITHAGVIRLLSVWQHDAPEATAIAAQTSVAPAYGSVSSFCISLS